MSRRTHTFLLIAIFSVLLFTVLYIWQEYLSTESMIVIYFGKPFQIIAYVNTTWKDLCIASFGCFATAVGCVFLAGVLAILLLLLGLHSPNVLRLIERLAASSQTVPLLVIATISLLIERQVFRFLALEPSVDWYCILPVTLILAFPPLINGTNAVARISVPIKGLLRIWDTPSLFRISQVYLPHIMTDILTGICASSTWAIGAVLIAEGLMNGVSGSTATLGHCLMMPFKQRPGETPTVLVVATVLGFLVYYVFSFTKLVAERLLYGRVKERQTSYPLQRGK